jgi:hypothetical protein
MNGERFVAEFTLSEIEWAPRCGIPLQSFYGLEQSDSSSRDSIERTKFLENN